VESRRASRPATGRKELDWLAGRKLDQPAAAVCPKCGAKTRGGKFCPQCGATLTQKPRCTACGAEAEGTPKSCPECGKPYAA
jgi:predicted amidophosphoribosyltransferase